MELRKPTLEEAQKVGRAVSRKHLLYCSPFHIISDYYADRMYVVMEGDKILATVSLVEEQEYGYTAVKRLCILNKKNQGKGIARFALRELQKEIRGRIGATPWSDNIAMRKLLESEGFTLQYIFDERWCFYAKD